MSGTVLDVLLVLMLVLYAVTGYRQGILVSTLSLVGFLGGGALGMWLLPSLLANVEWVTSNEVIRVLVLVFLVFLCATVGQAIAVPVGNRLRAQVRGRSGQAVDAFLGGLATVLAVSLLVWFVAGAVRGAAPTPVAKAIGESRVLATIDRVMPPAAGQLFAGFRSLLDQNGIPKVFGGLTPEPIQPVAPPESGVAATAGVQQASRSVVRVTGVAVACQRGQEGSGWVVAPGKVVTNAHVVAGHARGGGPGRRRRTGVCGADRPVRPGARPRGARGRRPDGGAAAARSASCRPTTSRWWPGSRWTGRTASTRPACGGP